MMKTSKSSKAVLLGVLAAGVGCCTAVLAESQAADQAARPGSFQAIMSTKSPGVFGEHLPAADQGAAAAGAAAKPGSFQAIMSAKSPGTFGPRAAPASEPAEQVAATEACRPGSFASITSAKLPPNARPGNAGMYKGCR